MVADYANIDIFELLHGPNILYKQNIKAMFIVNWSDIIFSYKNINNPYKVQRNIMKTKKKPNQIKSGNVIKLLNIKTL